MKNALIYLIVFAALQILVESVLQLISTQVLAEPLSVVNITIMSMSLSGVIILCLFVKLRWAEVSPAYLRSRQWGVLVWSALASLGMLVPSLWIQEMLPPLPDLLQEIMTDVMKEPLGYMAVGVFAPIVEELVFRGAILAALLTAFPRRWHGIVVSALLFALIHFNPAQMPHAFVGGVLLGWMYVRTGSIVPGVVFHWTNNTIAYILCNILPDPNITLTEFYHGNTQSVLLSVLFSLCIFIPSLLQLNRMMKKA